MAACVQPPVSHHLSLGRMRRPRRACARARQPCPVAASSPRVHQPASPPPALPLFCNPTFDTNRTPASRSHGARPDHPHCARTFPPAAPAPAPARRPCCVQPPPLPQAEGLKHPAWLPPPPESTGLRCHPLHSTPRAALPQPAPARPGQAGPGQAGPGPAGFCDQRAAPRLPPRRPPPVPWRPTELPFQLRGAPAGAAAASFPRCAARSPQQRTAPAQHPPRAHDAAASTTVPVLWQTRLRCAELETNPRKRPLERRRPAPTPALVTTVPPRCCRTLSVPPHAASPPPPAHLPRLDSPAASIP
jgi:hypothetical protein